MLTDDERDDLLRLFSLVEVDGEGYQEAAEAGEPVQMIGLGADAVVLRGEAQRMLNVLTEQLADHALTSGGPAASVIRRNITSACHTAAHQGRDAGLAAVDEFLENNETTDWLVIAENRDLVHDRDLDLGACRVQKQLLRLTDAHWTSERAVESLEPPVIYTTVTAFDAESALIIGRDRIGEARAILAIADSMRTKIDAQAVAVRTEGVGSRAAGSDDRLNSWTVINKDEDMRPLIPGFHELSEQAALDRSERTNWGKRVLAAARWYHRAGQTTWYSEAVSAAISALEALLVVGGENKGEAVARRATELGVLHGFDADGQRRWLKRLYRRRSGALHGGSVMDRDRDVEQLLDLARHVCRWGVWHLNPFHRVPEASCTSQADVFDVDLHRK